MAPDFHVEDVWCLPTPGGAGDLGRLVRQMAGGAGAFSRPVRVLFQIRWALGRLLGLDRPERGVGQRVTSLRDRLPEDLQHLPPGPDLAALPLTSVYLTDDEWVTELANATVHTLMHIGWVADGEGVHRGQMAVLVKPNGRLGAAYLAFIRPFRRLIVDPALVRHIGRTWNRAAA